MAPAPSLWLSQQTDDRVPALVTSRLPATADVVVVGGGVMGSAVAYWLTRLGAQVVLLESRLLAWGASGRNAGLLLAGASELESPSRIRTLLAEEGIDAAYEEPGHLALQTSLEMVETVRAEVASRPPTAPPLELLDREACESLLGLRMSPKFLAGRWLPEAALIDPVRLVRGLASAGVRRGAVVATKTAVLRVRGGRVETAKGTVQAGDVVLASGYRTGELAPSLAHALRPARAQMLATSPMRPVFRVGLAVDRGSAYWRQVQTGEIVLGGLRSRDPLTELTRREALNPRIQSALTAFLPEAFPGLGPISVRWRWSGTMDETSDGRPLVGRVPEVPGQWVIAGFGGHGLPAALGASRELAESIVRGGVSELLAPWEPARLMAEAVAS